MIMNNNINALKANNHIAQNQKLQFSSASKLSTGKKINVAADDSAGLAISSKMLAQIRGTDRAAMNVGEAIDLIDLADGAMNEMCAIIQRMRELSVQAANDTNTVDDRFKMQEEIAQLTSMLNRFSTDTNYNNKSLFDGSIRGYYGYNYGVKTMPLKYTPAVVEAQTAFTAPLQIDYGTAASVNSPGLVDLRELDSLNGFPRSGTFVITVTEPGETANRTVTAALDFAAVNASGSFTLAGFEQYFKDVFNNPPDGQGKIADFSLVNGKIQINTEAKGGSASSITMSGTAYDSIIGSSQAYGSATHNCLINTSAAGPTYEQSPYSAALEAFWNDIKGSLAGQSNTFQLWGERFQGTTGYATENIITQHVVINYSDYDTFAQLQTALNSAGLSIFLDRTGHVGISPNSTYGYMVHPENNSTYLYRNKVAITGGNTAFTNLFNNNTGITNNSYGSYYGNISAPPGSISTYSARVSDYIGILEISVSNPWGAANTCKIDFSVDPLPFMVDPPYTGSPDRNSQDALNAMVAYINKQLNINKPSPAATQPPSTPGYEVATATISGGRLLIQTNERGSTLSISESYSDKPMYNSSYGASGYNQSSQLSIRDRYGQTQTITLKPALEPYDTIDDFILANQTAFKNAGYIAKNVDGKLVLTSVGQGQQYTISSFSTSPSNLLDKLGLRNASITDGTTSTIRTDDPDYVYNGLWIQCGANGGNHINISLPSLNAHDLGLSLFMSDVYGILPYDGISKLGVNNYVTEPNVEAWGSSYMAEHGLDVLSPYTATNAIDIVDNALNIISTERSVFGSVKSRLEAIENSLAVTSLNLSATRSRIEDADMAKEMMNNIKYNVLTQASMAMLAQANSRHYDVIQLLKG